MPAALSPASTTLREQLQGQIDISGEHQLVFIPDEAPHSAQPLRIEYEAIQDLEFGQKVGRRMPLVAGTTVLLGPFGLLSLLSKRRVNYLTVAYADDEGKMQVAVFELGKRTARATLAASRHDPALPSSIRTRTLGNGADNARMHAVFT